MEFVQFHPTGIQGRGFLVTEAARGEGGYLVNSSGKRFMQNYAPKMLELASRDVISQAMATEIKNGEKIYLDLRHLSEEVLRNKLPGVVELVKNFVRLDVKKDLIPVSPSAHYTMGGIPTDLDCTVISGLMAIGETACISVHGANRLGCNSLLDLIVFGKIAGKKAGKKAAEKSSQQNTKIAEKIAAEKIEKLLAILEICETDNNVSLSELKKELQENNERHLGVFRDEKLLKLGLAKTQELYEIFKNYKIKDNNLIWNEELIAYFELENLLLNSLATNFSALNRRESRGAHYRSDFQNRDDKNFHAHSLVRMEGELEFTKKAVRNSSEISELNLELQKRSY
jgi:succinate dehydrogenase/fumarate reductase flavoprotein subunit